ncbi:four helix bundle protein [soil metagenome]
MATIKRFYDLEGWKKARTLNLEIYKMTRTENFKKDFILVDQVRRASVSIMANLAEGFGRKGNKEFLQFISIAEGSLCELQSHLFISLDVEYVSESVFQKLFEMTEETQRIIFGFAEYLRNSDLKGIKYAKNS